MCPLANQGRAQSAQDTQGLGQMAFWTPSPSALSTHIEPLGAALFCTHSTKAAIQGLGPRSPRASSCEPLTPCQAVPGLSGQACRALAKLRLALSLPTIHGARPCPPWKAAPRWPTAHSSAFPVGAVVQQSRGRRSSSSVRDGGPGPECTGGAPGQGPPLS